MNKLVSIIVPCYNGERFVDRCIQSIYIQDYCPIELIIVDDGSTDSSKKTIFEWDLPLKEKGITLKYIYQENRGLGGAIKTGLENAQGEYISLLDIDDEYLPDCVKDRVSFLDNHSETGCVITNGYVENKGATHLFSQQLNEINKSRIIVDLIRGDLFNWAGSYMVRSHPVKEFYTVHEYYCSRNGQNLQILLPVIYKEGAEILDIPHMIYHKQVSSLSSTDQNRMEKSIKNANDYYDIRMHVINDLFDEQDRERYTKEAEYGLWRNILMISIEYRNNDLSKEAYTHLRHLNILSLDDRINYYSLNSDIRYYLFRLLRKIKTIFRS